MQQACQQTLEEVTYVWAKYSIIIILGLWKQQNEQKCWLFPNLDRSVSKRYLGGRMFCCSENSLLACPDLKQQRVGTQNISIFTHNSSVHGTIIVTLLMDEFHFTDCLLKLQQLPCKLLLPWWLFWWQSWQELACYTMVRDFSGPQSTYAPQALRCD